MADTTYHQRRDALETYFDRTAVEAWAKLTSEAPVSGVRATVRAGRDKLRETFLSWLPSYMGGEAVLDAGCGAGQLAFAMAARGAHVEAVDLSPTLLDLAAERAPKDLPGTVRFRAGDMLDASAGPVDRVVAMDSVIHYGPEDMTAMIAALAGRARTSVMFSFAPRTPLLTVMHAAGKLFPKSDRAPAIVPISEQGLRRRIGAHPGLQDWRIGRTVRIDSFFYISQAMELVRR
ncbi:magnesium protoporphyrin IX methyltransferase [Alkalicaulis satelles]|uniref:Magnesium protoporphyrin IX methyltransferase n=1 Tax=Alkalicaulis satelles TaxID=2609175 RepID=A0A5M6ZJ41_9PROT|nr:magnesium protoporphyrin IX methyltransferase [Alkalicaulis satelles]